MKSILITVWKMSAALTALLAMLGALNCGATSYTLTNSGSWNVSANWNPNGVPSTADTVIIATGKAITGLGGTSPTITTLTIQGTGTLTVDAGTLTVSGVTTIGSSGAANLTISAGATFSSTSTASGAYVFGGTSSSITNNGTFTCTGGNGSGGTTPIFQNNGAVTFTGSQQEFNSAVAVIQGTNATLNLNSSSTTPFGGSSTLTATATGNTVSYASGASLKVTTYYNLTLNPSGTQNWQGSSSTIAGTLTVAGTGNLGNLSGLTLSGNLAVTGSGQVTANASLAVGGNVTVSSGTLYAQYGINVTGTTTINGGTLQLGNQSSGSGTFTGDFTMNGGTFLSNYSGQNDAVTFGGNLTVSSGTFTAGTGTHTFSGASKTITGTITIPNVAVSGTIANAGALTVSTALTGAGTLTQNASAALNLGGTSTIANLAASANTPNTVTYTSGSAQAVKANTYYNLSVSGSSTKTLGGAVTVNNTLTIGAGTLADGGYTLTAKAGVVNNGTHSGAGKISLTGGSDSHSLSGTGTYQNLELNDANNASIASGTSTISATGTLTLTSGQLGSGGGTLSLASGATISRAAGSLSLTPTFSTSVNVAYNDTNATSTGSEIPVSTTVLNNLTINNAAGVTLSANATLKGTLALNNGKLVTGANTVTVTSAGTISGGSATSYVYGKLDRGFTIGSGKSAAFPVGDSSVYAPVSLASATVSVAGDLIVSTTGNNNSQGAFSSSGLSLTKYVNRDWTITAATGYAETAGSITLNFVAGDVEGSMSPSTDVVGKYSGITWTKPTVSGRTSTSITVSGVTSFGDWVIGELPVPVFSVTSKSITYGTSSVSLNGTLSANSGTAYPVSSSTVTASINGHAVGSTFTDGAGDFAINYNHSSLATDGFGGSPYTITYSFAGDANLAPAVNDSSTVLTVDKAALSIAANDKSKTYGSAITLDGATDFTPTGLQDGETVGSVTLTPSGGTAATDPVSGSPYTITPSAAAGGTFNANNYTAITYIPGTLTVSPLAVSLTGSRAYDGTTNAAAAILSVANAVGSDSVSVSVASVTAGLAGKNVPAQAITSFDMLVLNNNADGDYTLTNATGTVTITQISASVSGIAAESKVYDGTNTATINTTNGVTLTGVEGGDDVTLDTNSYSAVFASVDAGTNLAVTVSGLILDGADATNYTLSPPAGLAADITPAPLTVTGITAADKVYDGNTNASIDLSGAALTGVIDADTNLMALETNAATAAFGDKNVGTNKSVTVTGLAISGDASTNYTLTQPVVLASITPAALMATAEAADKVYDGTTNAIITDYVLDGVIEGDDVSVASGMAAFGDKNVGTNKSVTVTGLVLSGDASTNYTLTQPVVLASITPASLTITADNKSKVYGMLNPVLTARYTGFVGGDDTNALTLQASLSTEADVNSVAGGYPITAGGAAADNYVISYVDGILTVVDQPQLGNAGVSEGQFVFAFPTVTGLAYQVEYNTDLTSGVWWPLGDVVSGTGESVSVTNLMTAPESYFRLLIQQP